MNSDHRPHRARLIVAAILLGLGLIWGGIMLFVGAAVIRRALRRA